MTIEAMITMDIAGVVAMADRIQARLSNLTPALLRSTEEIQKFISDRFRSETDPRGKPWAKLEASTLAKKAENKNKILVDTGALRNSITASPSITAGENSITLGSNVTYGGYHQFGTGKMEMRAFLPSDRFKGEPMTKLRERIARYILEYVTAP